MSGKRWRALLLLALLGLAAHMFLEGDPTAGNAQAHYFVGKVPTISEIFSNFR